MIGIFVFVGIIAVTALLFSGWALYGVIRAIVGGIGALISSPEPRRPQPALTGRPDGHARCRRDRCHAQNPPGAGFCRRCGASLSGSPVGLSSAPTQVFAAPARAGKRIAS
jgi:hypothetical protein